MHNMGVKTRLRQFLQATPTPVDISPQAKTPILNIDELAERVATLPALKFDRRLQMAEAIPSLSSKSSSLIYGSVTTQDIVKLIESEHGLTLVAPDAVVAFQNGQDRLRQTGSEVAEVNFSNGSTVYIGIEVVKAG
jgi:ribosomal protein L9